MHRRFHSTGSYFEMTEDGENSNILLVYSELYSLEIRKGPVSSCEKSLLICALHSHNWGKFKQETLELKEKSESQHKDVERIGFSGPHFTVPRRAKRALSSHTSRGEAAKKTKAHL